MMKAIQVKSLDVSLDHTLVLGGIDAAFSAGRWTSIVGPNGAGKSTLLKTLAGLLPFAGKVLLQDKPLHDWPLKQRARQVAWLGQSVGGGVTSVAAVDNLTAYDIVMLGRLPHLAWLALPSGKDHQIAEQSMRATHAWGWRARTLRELSGGECQRVLLARLLAVDADVLLMDEPLATLDPPHQADWISLVRELLAQGKTVITVLHEISIALQADEMLVMKKGRVLHQGACSSMETHQALQTVFEQRISIHQWMGQSIARLEP